jgi:hypothetical protein
MNVGDFVAINTYMAQLTAVIALGWVINNFFQRGTVHDAYNPVSNREKADVDINMNNGATGV